MYLLKQILLGGLASSTCASAAPGQLRQEQRPQHQQQLQPTPETPYHQGTEDQQHHRQAPNHTVKYFHEPGGGLELGHYDARFFRGKVPYAAHRAELRHLIRSYLQTMHEMRVETWLAHGTLLGWWWNGQIMPWDYDLDVQVTATTMARLGRDFNRTMHMYTYDDESEPAKSSSSSSSSSSNDTTTTTTKTPRKTKQYLLDVNPHHGEPGRADGLNVIDARWIDTSNGMFVDITALMEQRFADTLGKAPGVWSCKNYHHYATTELWPLRRSAFEGAPASVPYGFDPILRGEYGAKSLRTTVWQGHEWRPERKEWVRIEGEQEGDAVLQR